MSISSKDVVIEIIKSNCRVEEELSQALKPYEISLQQFNVLRILRGQKGKAINLQDIQTRMINKMSNTTRLVDKLFKKKFVKRIICKNNRRKVEISITDLGLSILDGLDPIIENTEQNITKHLNKQELKQLNNLLLKLNN